MTEGGGGRGRELGGVERFDQSKIPPYLPQWVAINRSIDKFVPVCFGYEGGRALGRVTLYKVSFVT